MNPRVKHVECQPNYKLVITFSNDEIKEFDINPYLQFPIYKKLQDIQFCSTAKAKYGTVIWDDETDFDPDTLYIESKSLSTTLV